MQSIRALSPAVKQLVHKHAIDPAALRASGPRGHILKSPIALGLHLLDCAFLSLMPATVQNSKPQSVPATLKETSLIEHSISFLPQSTDTLTSKRKFRRFPTIANSNKEHEKQSAGLLETELLQYTSHRIRRRHLPK
eukprot:gene6521-9378_t